MKNNKGFTLVEILSVIVLIALLLGLGVPGVMRINQNMKKRSLNTKIGLVEQAAVLYGQDNKTLLQSDTDCETPDGKFSCRKISIKDLIEDDYLDSETYEELKYTNPVDDSSMLDKCVYVYKKNNRVYSFYSNELCSQIVISSECNGIPYSDSPETLSFNLLCNATIANYNNDIIKTQYKENTITEVAAYKNGSNEKILSMTNDDYGISYFYRGNIVDNYLNFANMCWRIVRIQGDGSVKLVLEDKDDLCETSDGNWNIGYGNFGYEKYKKSNYGWSNIKLNYLEPSEESFNNSMINAFQTFQIEYLKDYVSYLKPENWCMEDVAYKTLRDVDLNEAIPLTEEEVEEAFHNYEDYYYRPALRLSSSTNCNTIRLVTYSCNEKTMNIFVNNDTPMYVAGLTADEVFFAGSSRCYINYQFYLMNDYAKDTLNWWTISPGGSKMPYYIDSRGMVSMNGASAEYNFRPAIVLKNNILYISGDGTKTNPYVIK